MMLAIDLDNEPLLMDHKVDDIWPQRRLTTYMYAMPVPELTEFGPQPTFAIRHRPAQPAGTRDCSRPNSRRHLEYPHP